MKNLLTLLLLVISLLASGQSDSQSLEVEIQYWKSIVESNDTVAYREYLQRYGDDGLYKDEALTRIALLKTSGKQTQSKNIECCFYTWEPGPEFINYIVRFDDAQDKVWVKCTNNYDTIRSNLAISKDFYENQAVALNHYKYKFAWTTNEAYQFDPVKSTSARDVYFKRDFLYEIHHTGDNTYSILIYSDDISFNGKVYVKSIEEYKKDYYKINTMQGYRYVAISKDKSSFIMWFEQDNNLDGVILKKQKYKRVPKEELLPKAVNYDFLNE